MCLVKVGVLVSDWFNGFSCLGICWSLVRVICIVLVVIVGCIVYCIIGSYVSDVWLKRVVI